MANETRVKDILDSAGDFLVTGLVGENTPQLQTPSVETCWALARRRNRLRYPDLALPTAEKPRFPGR